MRIDRFSNLTHMHLAPLVIGLCLLAAGVLLRKDYSITFDEPGLLEYGRLVLDAYRGSGTTRAVEEFSNLRHYGPLMPVTFALVDATFSGRPAAAWGWSHFATFSVFVLGVLAFYALAARRAGPGAAALGCAVLVLSPRLWSHAFTNPKDAPFLSLWLITVAALDGYAAGRRRWLPALVLASVGLSCVRVVGLALVAVAALVVARRRLLDAGAYLLAVALLTFAAWPTLWTHPVQGLIEAGLAMTHHSEGPEVMLYRGAVISTTAPPWHYLPTWVGITTPLPYLVAAAVGVVGCWRASRGFWALVLAWLVAPIAAAVLFGSRLYDEWRQVLFVYPALVLLAVEGFRLTWARRQLRLALALATAATLGTVAVTMARLHPYQGAFFNAAASRSGYEVDYWGLAYREGLARLLALQPGPVRLYVCTDPGEANAAWFGDRRRLKYSRTAREADVVLCAPRQGAPAAADPLFTIERGGRLLLYAAAAQPSGRDGRAGASKP